MNAYVSPELSTIREKDADRARLAQAMEGFVAQGKVIKKIAIGRGLFSPQSFNGTATDQEPKDLSVKLPKSAKAAAYEAELAEKMKAYYDRGMVAAAKDLHIGTRRASHIAALYGIKFASHSSLAARKEDLALVPKIRAMILEGLTQDQMCAELKIGRTTLKRVAGQNGLTFRSPAQHAKEKVLVERIKAIRDIGCTRAACARQLEINPKVLLRLIAEHEIDFPVSTPGAA
ncbi:hypothetical protein [Pseudomonas moorei]|uniref:Uncharacterized protein n=1 Tax=Pseudomonas moorei TaxID=395599 RepID=A0A1H1FL76_9PSED|nr:hypothetical protein [Pseudomonas moorei]KAB0509638.1 hypothetical protein F7R06_01055 [Pseudomonas moorei]SDR01614.1 hypothetical protein SAMN04490195_2761 [Pseudomonas moorei]